MKDDNMNTEHIEIVADLHTHSIASGHSYNAHIGDGRAASKRGLKMLGVTDHGPSIPGAPNSYYFGNMTILPEEMHKVTILRGIEANILNINGELDIPAEYADKLDIVLAGFHFDPFPPGDSIENNTHAILAVMDNKYVDGIAHPGNPMYPIDYETVIRKAVEKNILIEINNSSLRGEMRPGSKENCRKILKLVKKWKATILISSDAHCYNEVGFFNESLELLNEEGISEELILNTSCEKIKRFLATKGKRRFKIN